MLDPFQHQHARCSRNLLRQNWLPVLLKNFLAKRISLETMVILEGLLSYVGKWDKELHDDLVWPDSRRLIVKYGAFLSYDIHKCRNQLLRTIKETF